MKHLLVLLPLLFPFGDLQAQDTWLRFEDAPTAEVPAAFVYDPVTKQSQANQASKTINGAADASPPEAAAPRLTGSVTLECFFKPSTITDTPLVVKSRRSEEAAELSLATVRVANGQQVWCGATLCEAGATRPLRWAAGHYASSTRLTDKDVQWRHLAVVYDAAKLEVTAWVDYHLSSTQKLAAPLVWDDAPLQLGGKNVAGKLDEVRVTPRALAPHQFLRARADSITGVSFASTKAILPRDSGCLDAKEHFGAAGDGRTDDTAALNAAFAHLASKVPLAYNTLVIPEGTYLVSGMLHCSRFIDVKGAGPDKTIIRLQDGTFTDPANPQPVLRMSSTRGAPGSHKGVNGSSISLYLDGVTIDTGKGNPGAKGLEYHSNNIGRLENVVIRSGDGGGVTGLDLTHHDVGPALVKHVTVAGFDLGAAIRYQEYSMTFEHLTLRGQRVAGIRNQGNILAIRGLTSENRVPAILAEGANSMVTLLDSSLTGGAPDQPAIKSDGALYCLRVKTGGYAHAVAKRTLVSQKPAEWKESTITGPDLDEFIGDQPVTGHGNTKGALKLPIEDTPPAPAVPVSEWVSVLKFADHMTDPEDAAPMLQAAFDSGARVVYLPRGPQYRCKSAVHLRKVERVYGMENSISWHPSVWKSGEKRDQTDEAGAPPPLLIFDEPDAKRTIWLERFSSGHLHHASPATLVLKSCGTARYTNTSGCGKLFLEDLGGSDWRFEHPQRVWVRQWNPESHQSGPCILNRGATLWCLGFKTEYESSKLWAEAGAQTEILGAFIYPLGKIPPDRPIFKNTDSRMSLVYGASVYQANHKIHILDTRGADVKPIGSDQLKWAGSRARMDLYTSDAR